MFQAAQIVSAANVWSYKYFISFRLLISSGVY